MEHTITEAGTIVSRAAVRGPVRRFEALVDLLARRADLRGTYQTADYLAESVCWSA